MAVCLLNRKRDNTPNEVSRGSERVFTKNIDPCVSVCLLSLVICPYALNDKILTRMLKNQDQAEILEQISKLNDMMSLMRRHPQQRGGVS